jgi:hypothetical protein
MTVGIPSAKVSIPFRAGTLPRPDPESPRFTLDLDGVEILVTINAKAARKCAVHQGNAVLVGKLVASEGRLLLLEAGFQFLEPAPAPDPALRSPPRGPRAGAIPLSR